MVHLLNSMGVWIKGHPTDMIVGLWALLNVLWAQIPASWFKRPRLNAFLMGVHNVMQLVVTHASVSGTFTWPLVMRALLQSFGATIAPIAPSLPVEVLRSQSGRPLPLTPSGRPAPPPADWPPPLVPTADAQAVPTTARTPTLPTAHPPLDSEDIETPVDVPHPHQPGDVK